MGAYLRLVLVIEFYFTLKNDFFQDVLYNIAFFKNYQVFFQGRFYQLACDVFATIVP